MLEEVELAALIFDPICQPRVSMDTAYVQEWSERYADPEFEGPPIIVYYDEDANEYWVADGFCRGTGAKAAKRQTIMADLRTGTRRDAWKCSLGANATHGMRRTREDLRKAITAALQDAELVKLPDYQIAKDFVGCSPHTVTTVRRELESDLQIANHSTRTTANGRERPATCNTQARTIAPVPAADDPVPAPREVASPDPAPASEWAVEIPPIVAERLAQRPKFEEAHRLCQQLEKLVSDLCKGPAGEGLQKQCNYEEKGDGSSFWRHRHTENARRDIRCFTPFGPCPYCQAKSAAEGRDCLGCNGMGYVVRSAFDSAPPEMRAAVERPKATT